MDILIYVEDPGAANFMVGVAELLEGEDVDLTIVAGGAAEAYLEETGTNFTPLSEFQAVPPDWSGIGLFIFGTSENPDTPAFTFLGEAKRNGVRSIGIIDAATSIADRFRGRGASCLTHAPDIFLVTDSSSRKTLEAMGVEKNIIFIVQNPKLVSAFKCLNKLKNIDVEEWRNKTLKGAGKRPVITFLGELSDGLNPRDFQRDSDYLLMGSGRSSKRTDIVFESLLEVVKYLPEKPYIVVRLHPKQSISELGQYTDEVDYISQFGDPYELIYCSDVVVGMTSTLLVEASILGCRVLSVLPRVSERSWLPAIECGEIPCAHTIPEIRAMLDKLIVPFEEKPGRAETGDLIVPGVPFTQVIMEQYRVAGRLKKNSVSAS